MATTSTVYFPITLENSTGHLYYNVKYRLSGTSVFTQFSTSGSTAVIPGLQSNMLYDFQVINVNNTTNPASSTIQSAAITNPNPFISPVNTSISLSWTNLSTDITGYVTTIALASSPTTVLATHNPALASTITDIFTGLTALTDYIITIQPSIGVITSAFSYPVTTTAQATCPQPLLVTAYLI